MKYIRVVEGSFPDQIKSINLIPATTNLFSKVDKNRERPWFYSTFQYNQEHFNKFKQTRSVSGITDVTTNAIWWDFDNKDINASKESTAQLITRLKNDFPNIDANTNVKINFSGNKGFHVILDTKLELTPDQVGAFARKYAGDLQGFDTSLYDANQVIRLPGTQHEKSGLFCCPLTYDEFQELNIDEIKELSKSLQDFDYEGYKSTYKPVDIKYTDIPKVEVATKKVTSNLDDIDLTAKPKYLDDARWYLMNGYFQGSETADIGERNNAFLCLAATFKNLGFAREHTKGLLVGVAELQASRNNETEYTDAQLDKHILNTVYSPNWKGGQFTTKDPTNWLYKYAKKMGISENDEGEYEPKTIYEVKDTFTTFVKNIEKNTIKTGIDRIDKAMPITIGNSLGLVGAASSGKTAWALEVLKNTSKTGVTSVFASLDMHRNRLFEKLLYTVSGLSREEIYHKFKTGNADDLMAKIKKDYGNVWFYDRSSATVADIKRYVQDVEKKSGEKVKLVMVDYFERVNCDVSEDTAASKKVANELQDMMNDLDVALITLVQPNKFSLGGGPDKPILSYTAIKGSSFLYQSFRSILSLWRPFFRADLKEHDNYMQMAILKNDLGELDLFDFGWNGKRGEIYELEDIQRQDLRDLLKMKTLRDKGEDDGWN